MLVTMNTNLEERLPTGLIEPRQRRSLSLCHPRPNKEYIKRIRVRIMELKNCDKSWTIKRGIVFRDITSHGGRSSLPNQLNNWWTTPVDGCDCRARSTGFMLDMIAYELEIGVCASP